jgi:hypothetical protein
MFLFAICYFIQIIAAADAMDCPIAGRQTRRSLIASAQTCEEAARLFRLCATGASLDGKLALSVGKVCEKSFLAKLPPKERDAYQAAIDACNAPYIHKRGTLYRSAAAHCRVGVMADFAKGY